MNLERINKLIAHLEKVQEIDPDSFDLAHWFRGSSPEEVQQAMNEWSTRWEEGKNLNCGTTACLVGHLPLVFPENFRWIQDTSALDGTPLPVGIVEYINHGRMLAPALFRPVGDKESAAHNLVRFFGGTADEWCDIIYGEYYDTDVLEDHQVPITAVINKLKTMRGVWLSTDLEPANAE
jgi:hypothetical protein